MHHDSVGVETFWISPSLSRSHTLWLRLQKLEQRSRAPSRLCTLDIRGCRSQTLTLWVAHTHTHGYIQICTLQTEQLGFLRLFWAVPLVCAVSPTRWRCQRSSTTWSQRFTEEVPTTVTFSWPTERESQRSESLLLYFYYVSVVKLFFFFPTKRALKIKVIF